MPKKKCDHCHRLVRTVIECCKCHAKICENCASIIRDGDSHKIKCNCYCPKCYKVAFP